MKQLIQQFKKIASTYNDKVLFKIFVYGFASGLCLLLSGNTLNFWLASIGIKPITLGLFSLVTLPYLCKYIWSPLIDVVEIKWFSKKIGKLNSWILLSQVFLVLAVYAISLLEPTENLSYFALSAFFIALFSVTQDMGLDAKRINITPEGKSGASSAMYIFGYRIGMLVSGAGAIYISSFFSWQIVYKIMALILAILSLIILIITPKTYKPAEKTTNLFNRVKESFVTTIKQYGPTKRVLELLILILFYQSGDHILGAMRNAFVLEIGFNEIEIAKAAKFFGVAATIMGGLISGHLLTKIRVKPALFWFGIIHSISHGFFIIQYYVGYHLPLLYLLVAVEGITGGMATAVLFSFIASLCDKEYTSTQHAFLSSMIGLSRVGFSSISGFLLAKLGWVNFFITAMIIIFPSLLIIKLTNRSEL